MKRVIDKAAGVEKVRRERKCRVCPAQASERHHLVSRSLGGDDLDDNLVPLCHSHHMEFEHEPWGRVTVGAKIRASLRPSELGYVVTKKSMVFLDRMYPLRGMTRAEWSQHRAAGY